MVILTILEHVEKCENVLWCALIEQDATAVENSSNQNHCALGVPSKRNEEGGVKEE